MIILQSRLVFRETRVVGHHKKIGLISDSLKKRLLDNGISNKELEEFMQPPKEVG